MRKWNAIKFLLKERRIKRVSIKFSRKHSSIYFSHAIFSHSNHNISSFFRNSKDHHSPAKDDFFPFLGISGIFLSLFFLFWLWCFLFTHKQHKHLYTIHAHTYHTWTHTSHIHTPTYTFQHYDIFVIQSPKVTMEKICV